jgi:hypothetical protein
MPNRFWFLRPGGLKENSPGRVYFASPGKESNGNEPWKGESKLNIMHGDISVALQGLCVKLTTQKDAEYADYADERGFNIKNIGICFYPCIPLNPRIPRPALKLPSLTRMFARGLLLSPRAIFSSRFAASKTMQICKRNL